MKQYIKPEIIEEVVIVEDVIAASTTRKISFGDFFASGSSDSVDDTWYK